MEWLSWAPKAWGWVKTVFRGAKDADRLRMDIERLKEEQSLRKQLAAETVRADAAERALAWKGRLRFDNNVLWGSESEGGTEAAYCSRCWDADRKAVRLTLVSEDYYQCRNCEGTYDTSVGVPGPTVTIDRNAAWKDHPDGTKEGPFCQACYGRDEKFIPLGVTPQGPGRQLGVCGACSARVWMIDQNAPPRAPARRVRSSGISGDY